MKTEEINVECYTPEVESLIKLDSQKKEFLRSLPFPRAVNAVIDRYGGGGCHPRKVAWFRDNSTGTLNTGEGISVFPSSKEEANVAILIGYKGYSKENKVQSIIAPNFEFTQTYYVGHGHYGSMGIKKISVGDIIEEE